MRYETLRIEQNMDFNVVNWGLISMCQKSVFCSCELHIGIRKIVFVKQVQDHYVQ